MNKRLRGDLKVVKQTMNPKITCHVGMKLSKVMFVFGWIEKIKIFGFLY